MSDYCPNTSIATPQQQSAYEKSTSQLLIVRSIDNIALLCLSVGTVLLVLLDWLGVYTYISMDVSKYFRAFLLGVFILYIIITGINLSAYNFRFGRVLTFFILLCLIYSMLSDDVSENLYYSIRSLFWILGTVVAYRLFITGLFTAKILRCMIIATVILAATFTFLYITDLQPGEYYDASAYLLLWCMPLLFLIRKSWFVNICIAIATIAIMVTVKRGAIIGLVVSSAMYGLIYLIMNLSFRSFIRSAFVLMALGIIVLYSLSLRWDLIEKRFEDTSGSGRDILYPLLINHYRDADITNQIFGFGINSVQRYTGWVFHGSGTSIYAHSDWLQITHDFGVFGIILLVWLHLQFLTLIFRQYKNNSPHAPPLIMGYVILFLVNIYSGHMMSPNTIYLGLLWAITPSENFTKLNE